MKKFIFLTLLTVTEIAFASTFDIRNAKIGSTILKDYIDDTIIVNNLLEKSFDNGTLVGHAGIVINEYDDESSEGFIAEIYPTIFGLEGASSYRYFLSSNQYLGHYRSKRENYTKRERELIKKAAMQAIHTNASYAYIELYTYDWDFTDDNNMPYSINTVPTDFRCDGLAEWAVEVATNPTNPSQSDGFYSFNLSLLNVPIRIKESPIDTIGIPNAPTLINTDISVNASFLAVSGAWYEPLYALYRSTSPSSSRAEVIYCGENRFYRDPITDDMEGEYFYYLKIGERTASCDDTDIDFSEFSEYSSVTIQQECQSPKLFEVLSQTDINTPEWRVSVKNIETNETKDTVLPFNLNGSLYPLDSGEWVLASCGGKAYTTEWENSIGFYTLNNPEEEKIIFDRFKFGRENDLTIIDTKTSLVWNNTNLSLHNWTEANNICAELTLEPYTDWRMPTFNELKSILNSESNTHVYEDFFTQLSSIPYGYWSSNTFTSYDMAWSYWLGWYLVEVEESLVLNYTNASYLLLDTKYDMNLMCVQAL